MQKFPLEETTSTSRISRSTKSPWVPSRHRRPVAIFRRVQGPDAGRRAQPEKLFRCEQRSLAKAASCRAFPRGRGRRHRNA